MNAIFGDIHQNIHVCFTYRMLVSPNSLIIATLQNIPAPSKHIYNVRELISMARTRHSTAARYGTAARHSTNATL